MEVSGPKYHDAGSAICRATGEILKTFLVDIVDGRMRNDQHSAELVEALRGLRDEFDVLDSDAFFDWPRAQAWLRRVADLLPELWD